MKMIDQIPAEMLQEKKKKSLVWTEPVQVLLCMCPVGAGLGFSDLSDLSDPYRKLQLIILEWIYEQTAP